MNLNLTLGDVIFGTIKFLGYLGTVMFLAYHFGKKVSSIESKVANTMDKWNELAVKVEKISDRMWEDRKK